MATPLLLCALLCSYYSIALGGNDGNFVVVPTSSIQPGDAACSTSTATLEPNRASLPLAHIHSSCAPSGTTKDEPSFSERLRRSNARAKYSLRAERKYITVTGKASGRMTTLSDGGGVSIPTNLGDSVDSLEYVVTLGIGTPPVLIDTGSSLTWVQCQPCDSGACYPQKDPLFDPSSSSTYAAFSYCLPSANNSTGFLTLGAPSYNSTSIFMFTPMRRLLQSPTFYMVTLTDIIVGGKQLNIPSEILSGGMVMDSGTVVTRLPNIAYEILRSAFRDAMSQYPLLPPSEGGVDTCYNFTGYSNVTVPKVVLALNGGVFVELDVPSGVLVNECLAFQGVEDTMGIIGNVNQRTYEVLYDVARGQIGFRAGAC